MIALYCNQTATWKRPVSFDAYGKPTYSETTIRCRIRTSRQEVRQPNGETVTSSQTIYTQSAVVVGDLVADRVAVAVNTMHDLSGAVQWYEVQTL